MSNWSLAAGDYLVGYSDDDIPTLVVMERDADGVLTVVADVTGQTARGIARMLGHMSGEIEEARADAAHWRDQAEVWKRDLIRR